MYIMFDTIDSFYTRLLDMQWRDPKTNKDIQPMLNYCKASANKKDTSGPFYQVTRLINSKIEYQATARVFNQRYGEILEIYANACNDDKINATECVAKFIEENPREKELLIPIINAGCTLFDFQKLVKKYPPIDMHIGGSDYMPTT